MKSLLYFFMNIVIVDGAHDCFSKPRECGYSLQLTEEYVDTLHMHRTLDLMVDSEQAGHVKYRINRVPSGTSQIDLLFVEKKFRGVRGCGKMLLHSAINDMLFQGSTSIMLNRYPFNLNPHEDWKKRDDELKKWYTEFGFVESGPQSGLMKLLDPAKFYATQVITAFTGEGLIFLFR